MHGKPRIVCIERLVERGVTTSFCSRVFCAATRSNGNAVSCAPAFTAAIPAVERKKDGETTTTTAIATTTIQSLYMKTQHACQNVMTYALEYAPVSKSLHQMTVK